MKLDKFTYMLAPIEDMTGNAFRSICHKYGADVTFTVMTRVEGLARANESTWSRLDFKDDTPTVIQLLGAREMYFAKFLSKFEPHKGFLGFNLNIGCPAPQIVSLGQGCAMVKRVSKVKKIAAVFADAGYPFSLKMRLGLNNYEKEKKTYLNLIDAVDADFFVVHARHGAQTYAEKADISIYAECVKSGKNIIANGDIGEKDHIEELKAIGLKGAMIGRAAIANPAIFGQLKGMKVPPVEAIVNEYILLSEKYGEAFKYRKNPTKWTGKEG